MRDMCITDPKQLRIGMNVYFFSLSGYFQNSVEILLIDEFYTNNHISVSRKGNFVYGSYGSSGVISQILNSDFMNVFPFVIAPQRTFLTTKLKYARIGYEYLKFLFGEELKE